MRGTVAVQEVDAAPHSGFMADMRILDISYFWYAIDRVWRNISWQRSVHRHPATQPTFVCHSIIATPTQPIYTHAHTYVGWAFLQYHSLSIIILAGDILVSGYNSMSVSYISRYMNQIIAVIDFGSGTVWSAILILESIRAGVQQGWYLLVLVSLSSRAVAFSLRKDKMDIFLTHSLRVSLKLWYNHRITPTIKLAPCSVSTGKAPVLTFWL
jgi:hypothetical protein